MKKTFYFLPRVLAILLILFISMFALDVFSEPQWPLALLIHLIPSFILIILTIIAWKKSFLGGILFLIYGLTLLWFSNFRAYVIVIPVFIIAALFLLEKYFVKNKNR